MIGNNKDISIGRTTDDTTKQIESITISRKIKLYFNGIELKLFIDNEIIIFPAVSGRPIEYTENGEVRFLFDYSKERQKLANIGPIPEGNYFIKTTQIQKMANLSMIDKVMVDLSIVTTIAGVKISKFPGGYYAWGSARVRIYKQDNLIKRDNFFIHGGPEAGSAGA
ncbi:hypothetical protein [Actinobacillus vicugnae]|uniref:hypothetical protein n=1 Tax=Actinobacillus vicugnae TaxID=2573093 RepID=UPI001FCC6E5B|nr:hypothetical protein [Actinobacillus vicugnae]